MTQLTYSGNEENRIEDEQANYQLQDSKTNVDSSEECMVVHPIRRSALAQVWLGLLANFTCIAPGMSIGFSAIILPYLLADSNPNKLTANQGSWVASIAAIATPFGCFIIGPISDRFGRKCAFHLIHIVGCVGWVIIATSCNAPEHQYSILLIGRLITGISSGLASTPASVYAAEVSSPKFRGMSTMWAPIFYSIGVIAVYFLGYINKENWLLTSVIASLIPVVGIILTQIFIIESPAWLIARGDSKQAKKNMCRLLSTKEYTSEVQQEINAIMTSKEKAQAEITANYSKMGNPSKIALIVSNLKYFTGRTVLKPFILMSIFFLFQECTGSSVVSFYAVSIAIDAGVTIDGFLAAVLTGLIRLISSILAGFISKRYGRRPTTIVSGVGMTISMIPLGFYVLVKSEGYISIETAKKISWFPMVLLSLFLFTNTLGFSPMPYAMSVEIFPTRVRGTASGILACLGNIFTFIVVKLYPTMVESMRAYGVFFFYGIMSLMGTTFVALFLPETKGKTLEEIEEYFRRRQTKKGTYSSPDVDTNEA